MTAILAFLFKWLPWLGKLSGLAAVIPGGQVFAAIGAAFAAVGQAFAWVIKWLFADIADGFKEPQRFIVRIGCMLLVFAVGGYSGIHFKGERDAEKIAAISKKLDAAEGERDQWRNRHAQQIERASRAEAARDAAEARMQAEQAAAAKAAAERAAAPQPAPAAVPPAPIRVRARPAAPAPASAGSGLFGLPALFGLGK